MSIQSHVGEIASLLTAVCWTFSAIYFEKAGRRVGSLSVNIIRIFLGVIFLGITTLFTRGMFFPIDATPYNWFWLGLSGIVGFFLGDLFLFKSYTIIGSRTSQLVMSLAPMITAVIGWFFLSEYLTPKSIAGIVVSVTGIMIAVAGKKLRLDVPVKGFLYAIGGALGQAVGLILSKKGMGDYDAIAATQIRAIFGFAAFALLVTFMRRWRKVILATGERKSMNAITIGAMFGPFIGVSLSLFAVKHTETGIASALMALTPIFIIIPSAIMFKEKITARQVTGAVISIIGASIFFL
ncbi:MAG TPA: DMT family transporter [Fermentimonas caenicola]|jgi:drug/metabolite transporter (DMT)-like permease|uniref:EamA domain-containing protein n=1 Tax=Fermentimonas caenicola TaxID=1562970 RepID=A0A098C1S7_9BACT|nr:MULTISPECIES: DMT family transporter [Lascolabacillus]MBP6175734.1 DMT family transporter [Fermentimonas sp.]MDI9625568.1 DMT family transporter [Bacteroidota bacterium]TAH62357.1 MAG: DMT family transporter [Fermentimonas caenicola]MBP6196993.1 DMT family transporter [Fermentimonas sp.]MCK9501249.1 DMT family transporter [Lascolabacillus sp.]